MALLQVRDFPASLYGMLTQKAMDENRSITQQTIYMLSKLLTEDSEATQAKSRRRKALASLDALNLQLPKNCPPPEQFLHQDRESDER